MKVLFVFFTPKEGLTSILLLSADMSGPLNVQVESCVCVFACARVRVRACERASVFVCVGHAPYAG